MQSNIFTPTKISVFFLIFVYVAHLLDGHQFFGNQYISQIKHGNYPIMGLGAFLILAGLLGYLSYSFYQWKRYFFSFFYGINTINVLGLMSTHAESELHGIFFCIIVMLPLTVFYLGLYISDYLQHFFIFTGLIMTIPLFCGLYGGVVGQKILVMYFLLFINCHYFWFRPKESNILQSCR